MKRQKRDEVGTPSFLVWRIGRAFKLYPLNVEHASAYTDHIHSLWKANEQMRKKK